MCTSKPRLGWHADRFWPLSSIPWHPHISWVQRARFNPYCCVPVDARLAHLRDTVVFRAINRSDFARTIYPPVDQMAFLANAWLGGTVLSMKLLLVAVEGVGIWAMMAVLRATGRSPSLVLLYAWHPLPIWEIAGGGHVDALLVAFIPLAVPGRDW